MNKLIYILAASHSGSTLLSMLLGAHPGACTVGELKISSMGDPQKYRCSCGEPIINCLFWKKVAFSMNKKGISFNLATPHMNISDTENKYFAKLLRPMYRGRIIEVFRDLLLSIHPNWRSYLKTIQTRNSVLVETLTEITGAKVVIDSSKIGIRLKYLLKNDNFDVYVIRLIRDGRGVALTYVNPMQFADATDPELRAGGLGGYRKSITLTFKQAVYEWKKANEEAEHITKNIKKSRLIEIKYETLCTKTEDALNHIYSIIGLESNKSIRDFRSVTQHVIGNGMRLDRTSKVALDERWKTQLSETEFNIFNEIAGNLNRKYGYS